MAVVRPSNSSPSIVAGSCAVDDRDLEPGIGAGDAEHHPVEPAAGDQQLDIIGHPEDVRRQRRCPEVGRAPLPGAFPAAAVQLRVR